MSEAVQQFNGVKSAMGCANATGTGGDVACLLKADFKALTVQATNKVTKDGPQVQSFRLRAKLPFPFVHVSAGSSAAFSPRTLLTQISHSNFSL
jgi:hypothetical protein